VLLIELIYKIWFVLIIRALPCGSRSTLILHRH